MTGSSEQGAQFWFCVCFALGRKTASGGKERKRMQIQGRGAQKESCFRGGRSARRPQWERSAEAGSSKGNGEVHRTG